MHGRLSYEFVSRMSDCFGSKCIEVCQYQTEKLADQMKKQLQSKVLREIDKNLKEFGVKVAEENMKSFSALLD